MKTGISTNILAKIIAKELRDFRSDKRVQWVLLALYLLFALALFSGWHYFTQTQPRHEAAQAASYRQWLAQGTKNPHSAAHYGLYAYKPVPLLAVVDKGMDEYLGVSVWMEAHKQNSVSNRTAHDMADVSRFGSLVLSKFLFRFVVVSLVVAVVLLAGIGFAGVNLLQAASELALMLLVVVLYAAFWFALSFAVNSFGRNSGVNAALLLGVWLLLVLIIPSVLTIAATTLHPAPSRVELITQTREASDAAKKRTAQLLSKFYEDHPELLPKDKEINPKDFATASLTAQMEVDKILKPLQDRFRAQTEAQQSLIGLYRFLSPSVFVQQTLNDIAGTGYRRYADFNAQAYGFYQRFQQFFVGKVFRQERMTSADFERIPTFSYAQTAPILLVTPNVLNLALLLALSAAFVSVGLRRTAQLRVVGAVA